jgi:hypothetical protein
MIGGVAVRGERLIKLRICWFSAKSVLAGCLRVDEGVEHLKKKGGRRLY